MAGTGPRICYRMLVLDQDIASAELIHSYFRRTALMADTSFSAFLKCDTFKLYAAEEESQLADLPDVSTLNVAWINANFPNAPALAQAFYRKNPFCYMIIYGSKEENALVPFLRARPIGYIPGSLTSEDISRELLYISSLEPKHEEALRLRSRDAFCDIPVKGILYCQSQGRQTYLYTDSLYREKKSPEEERFIVHSAEKDALLAYEQHRKLDEVEQLLGIKRFIRIHQSYLINRDYAYSLITGRDGWFLILKGRCGKCIELPVSEKYRKDVRAWYESRQQICSLVG